MQHVLCMLLSDVTMVSCTNCLHYAWIAHLFNVPLQPLSPPVAWQVRSLRVRGSRLAGRARARGGASARHTPHPPAARRRHPADSRPPLAPAHARHPLPQRTLQVRYL